MDPGMLPYAAHGRSCGSQARLSPVMATIVATVVSTAIAAMATSMAVLPATPPLHSSRIEECLVPNDAMPWMP